MKKFKFDKLLENESVSLRKHSLEIAETMFKYVDRDRERLDRFLPWVVHTKTLTDEINYIKHTHECWDNCTFFDYSIFEKSNDTYLGNIGVHTIDWENNVAELGYWILGEFEGQGYISKAVQILERYLFKNNFNRIEIRCSSINQKSAFVPLRNAYTLEGELKQNSIEKGEYRNTKIFAKLNAEYDN